MQQCTCVAWDAAAAAHPKVGRQQCNTGIAGDAAAAAAAAAHPYNVVELRCSSVPVWHGMLQLQQQQQCILKLVSVATCSRGCSGSSASL